MRRGRTLRERFTRLRREQRGVAAVEFAFVAPIFLAVVFAILDLSLDYWFAEQMDNATYKASLQLANGSVQIQNLNADQFKSQVLCPLLPSFVTCNNVVVNVQIVPWSTWYAANGYTTFDTSTHWITQFNRSAATDLAHQLWCPAPPAQMQVLQVAYPTPFMSTIWSGSISANGTSYAESQIAFWTDPYSYTYSPPAGC